MHVLVGIVVESDNDILFISEDEWKEARDVRSEHLGEAFVGSLSAKIHEKNQ